MKKYAFILMGPDYNPKTDHAHFETPGNLSSIFTVNNFEDAKTRVLQCKAEGYGCLELCGAFGDEKANELLELSGEEIAIGFVVHFPKQDALFNRFFS